MDGIAVGVKRFRVGRSVRGSKLQVGASPSDVLTVRSQVALGDAAEGVVASSVIVPAAERLDSLSSAVDHAAVETLGVEVAIGDAAEGVVASSAIVPAAERLDSLSSAVDHAAFVPAADRLDSLSNAVGLDPFRSVGVDALHTSFLSMPTEELDYLVGALQALRHEFEPDALQQALAPLVNVEGVLLAALYARLSAPSLRHFDEVNIGSGHIYGPDELLDFFYHCCDYQDVRELEDWLQQLRDYRASELAGDDDPIGDGPVGDRVFDRPGPL
jgi:hypothetical protein